CAITWHQWQAAYPTDSRTGTSRRFASANASSDHGHQSTGLSACCSRYGLVAFPSRFIVPILTSYAHRRKRADHPLLGLPHLDGLDLHGPVAVARGDARTGVAVGNPVGHVGDEVHRLLRHVVRRGELLHAVEIPGDAVLGP